MKLSKWYQLSLNLQKYNGLKSIFNISIKTLFKGEFKVYLESSSSNEKISSEGRERKLKQI